MPSFFLWPVIIPILIPIAYCLKWKRESLGHIWPVALCLVLIVLLFEPLVWGLDFPVLGYAFWKSVLFVFLPLAVLCWHLRGKMGARKIFAGLGVRRRGAGESLKLGMFLLPVMLISTTLASLWLARHYSPSDVSYSGIMFAESFTEEFFFRGIMFLYLWKLADIRVAYVTSIIGFVLLHPQYFWGAAIVPAIVQGVLTAIIVHKSKNLAGPWLLHGTARVFSLSVLPYFF
jgi:membrane protease YdiL (CAAX protease family)